MISQRVLSGISMMFVLATLAACGGGGGGDSAVPAPASTTCTWDMSTWNNCNWGS